LTGKDYNDKKWDVVVILPIKSGDDFEMEAVLRVGELMAISARTAPKARGVDDIEVALIYGEEKEKLAEQMQRIGEMTGLPQFKRDAEGVRGAHAVLLVGVRGTNPLGLNCGMCGFRSCDEYSKAKKIDTGGVRGPLCAFKLLDLGIAVGSAVKTASIHNVDNRVMITVGIAARMMKLLKNSDVILGIPIVAAGKNPFFDRKT